VFECDIFKLFIPVYSYQEMYPMNPKHASTPPVSDRWPYLWLVVSAVLVFFTYGMYRIPLAGLLAYVFLIRFMRSRKVRVGYLFTYLVLVIANTISWWNTDSQTPPAIRIIFFGLVAGLLYSIPLLLDRVLVRRFRGFAATLVFPFASTGFEFLTIWPNPLSAFGSLANSQFGSLDLTQLMSITGMWGVTFLVSWFASTVNWIWEEGLNWQRIRRGVALYAGVMLIVLAYGTFRLTFFLPQPGTVRIHGVVETGYTREEWVTKITPLNVTDPVTFRAVTVPTFERYLQSTLREAQAGAQIVVWPELAAEGYREDVDALLEQARNIARQQNIYLAIGVGIVSSKSQEGYLAENRLILIDPQGEVVVNQLKYGCGAFNMYDFDIQTVDTPYGRLAGVVCCDLDYPYVIRQVSQKGVDILLVPSFEPTTANIVAHSQMAPFRAIENGVSIFRPTSQGISQAIDPYGRLLGSMNHTTASETVLVAQVPNRHIFTIYSVVGDLFGWLTVAGFVFMVGWAILRGRRAGKEA
jgi:apolipoprotein N-acyltransferase